MTTTVKERLTTLRNKRNEEIEGMKRQRDADIRAVYEKWQSVINGKKEEWTAVLTLPVPTPVVPVERRRRVRGS